MPQTPKALRRLFHATVVLVLAAQAVAAQPRPVKVYISADMEGITGVVSGDQLGPTGFEYNRFREYMTAEVLAAMQGAREAGATEFVVSDSHGNGESLLIDKFPPDVTIIRSFPRPLVMMQGIDSTFAAAIFIGYHSATTSTTGVRAHTISSALLTRVALNGTAMSEAGINAAIAAHFGVPVVMISGDDAIVAQAKQQLGNIEGAVVKRAISFHSAATMTPDAGQALIRERAKAAVARRGEIRQAAMSKPITLEVSFKNYRPVELLGYLPNVQRIDAHTVRFVGRDVLEISRFLEFVTSYDPTLAP
jgi:D-amino peptidase